MPSEVAKIAVVVVVELRCHTSADDIRINLFRLCVPFAQRLIIWKQFLFSGSWHYWEDTFLRTRGHVLCKFFFMYEKILAYAVSNAVLLKTKITKLHFTIWANWPWHCSLLILTRFVSIIFKILLFIVQYCKQIIIFKANKVFPRILQQSLKIYRSDWETLGFQ